MTLVVPGKTTANEHEEKQIENWLPLVWTSIRFSSCLFAVAKPHDSRLQQGKDRFVPVVLAPLLGHIAGRCSSLGGLIILDALGESPLPPVSSSPGRSRSEQSSDRATEVR